MPKPVNCIVPGCPNSSHAKGYCRRHYGQIWRRGMVYDEQLNLSAGSDSSLRHDDQERLRALERELQRAWQIYNAVVGFQGRIRWRREIEAVQMEINKLNQNRPAPELVGATVPEVEVLENTIA